MNLSLIFRTYYLFFIPFFLMGCGVQDKKPPVEERKPIVGPQIVGRVASIQAEKSFILIQAYGTWKVSSGSILTTQGPNGRAANVRVTGEKLGQYAAADIQSGTLEIGDAVQSISSPTEELPENQNPDENEATQLLSEDGLENNPIPPTPEASES